MNTRPPSKVRDVYWVNAENLNPIHDWSERSGKWLIFTSFMKLDETWKVIKEDTINGLLGVSAKAATAKPNSLAKNPWIKVICVYTYDSNNYCKIGDPMHLKVDVKSFFNRLIR